MCVSVCVSMCVCVGACVYVRACVCLPAYKYAVIHIRINFLHMGVYIYRDSTA